MSGVKGAKSKKATEVPNQVTRRSLFRLLDGRSKVSRLLCDRRAILTMGLGGSTARHYEDNSLLGRFLSLESILEKMESRLYNGEAVDLQVYFAGLNTFTGMKKQISALRRVMAESHNEHDPLLIEHAEAVPNG